MSPFQLQYEYFLVLCQTQNISRAAELLNMGQGSLSKALTKLEDSLKTKLFIRQGRGIKPTEFGILLEKRLLSMKDLWQRELAQQKERLDEIVGHFKIGVHPSIAITTMDQSFPTLLEKYPLLDLELTFAKSSETLRKVINFELDIGLVANPLHHPDLVIKRLSKEYVSAWSPSPKSPRPVVYFNPEMININTILKRFKRMKLVPIKNYEVLAAFAAKSRGLAILPNPLGERNPSLRPLGKKFLEAEICLIYRADRPKTTAFQTVLKGLI